MTRARVTSPFSSPTLSKGSLVTASTRRGLAVAAALATVVAGGVIAAPAAMAAPAPAPTTAVFLAPYYTELDLTGDEQVTADDLALVAAAIGATAEDPLWDELAQFDVDADSTVDVADLAELSQRIIYDDGPFELVEADVVEIQSAMNAGVVTSVELTQDYIDRIKAYDKTVISGTRPLNSIITVGETTALAAAAQADAIRAEKGMTSMLLGVPTAVKDNYNTVDMPTTAGCGCWDGNQTSTDAHMIEGLRADGAVILAKTSLDEFAYGFVSEYTTGQAAGTSTFVASPYNTGRSAGGSSGGTGAAIAANLAGIGFGTDTGGSIRVPASYNQLVGVRPTVGLASRAGIVPLALSQDTGGPITRSVTDAAVALDAVIGVDADDAVTSRQQGKVPASYASYLDADSLTGTRIGYVASMVGTNATTVRLWNETLTQLRALGATVVEVPGSAQLNTVLNEGSGSTNEFKHDLDEYIDDYLNPTVTADSLTAILDSGRFVNSRRNVYNQRNAVTPETYTAWAGPEGSHTKVLADGKVYVTGLMDTNDLDAMIYPSGTPYNTQGTNLRLSPNTGLPSVSVPMGQASATESIPGAGVNLELLGRDFSEGPLLGLAYSFEQATNARTAPTGFGPLAAG
ncbi:amidase family protein [Microbacterium sp. P05]|uniref:amidase family protein n=1 Tax=Microbacterium sp. P05 TaxID=3366948 RepID=UPI003747004D